MKKLISILLAVVMLCGLVACGDTSTGVSGESNVTSEKGTEINATEETEEVKEPVVITLYPRNANLTSGQVGGWLGEWLLERGIILEVWAYSDEKFNAILASGELPDIMYLPKGTEFEVVSESGMLLDLEPHMDKLPHVTGNEKLQVAIGYMKEYVSGGKLNMLPLTVGALSEATDTGSDAIKLNWEVYEEIGCPEFSNMDELVDIFKTMQEAYPVNKDGKKTYAMQLYGNMDKTEFYGIRNYYAVTGYDWNELAYFLETNLFEESYDYILDDSSNYKAAMKFFNQLYREGLLDPESINLERTAVNTNQEAGGTLAGWRSCPGYEKNGYYPVYFDELKVGPNQVGNVYGDGEYVAVNAKTENLDRVLEFIDMLADPDAILTIRSGVEGELWEINDANEVVMTQKGIDYFVNGEVVTFANGEEYALFNTAFMLAPAEQTSYGSCVALDVSAECAILKSATETMARWQANYGVDSIMDLLTDENIARDPFYININKFAAKPTDEQSLIVAAAKDIIVPASWEMVYAEDDAEFEKIWAGAVKKCEELGVKDLVEWRLSELENGKAIRDSIGK